MMGNQVALKAIFLPLVAWPATQEPILILMCIINSIHKRVDVLKHAKCNTPYIQTHVDVYNAHLLRSSAQRFFLLSSPTRLICSAHPSSLIFPRICSAHLLRSSLLRSSPPLSSPHLLTPHLLRAAHLLRSSARLICCAHLLASSAPRRSFARLICSPHLLASSADCGAPLICSAHLLTAPLMCSAHLLSSSAPIVCSAHLSADASADLLR